MSSRGTPPTMKHRAKNGDVETGNSQPERVFGRLDALSSASAPRRKFRSVMMVIGVIFFFGFTMLYSGALMGVSRDPCQVAAEALIFAKVSRDGKNELPKIIHQQWKTDVIPEGNFVLWNNKWKELYPEPTFKHMLWTDVTMRELIAKHYEWFLPTYDGYPHNIERADSSRYFILHHYGGLYADLDYEPLLNFWDFLPADRVSLIESPYRYNEYVQNSLMAGPPGAKFWDAAFKVLQERAGSAKVLWATGPSMLTGALEISKTYEYYEMPCENYHRIPLGKDGETSPILAKMLRNVMAHTQLVKACGFNDLADKCLFGIHHNTAIYVQDTGVMSVV